MDDFSRYANQLFVLPFLLLALSACSKVDSESQPKKATSVSASKIDIQPSYSTERQFIGLSSAVNSSELGFELAGKLIKLNVNIGDNVIKNQELASIDTSLLKSARKQIKANLARTGVQLKLAERTLSRSQTMSKKSFVSEQKIDEQKTQLSQLKAQLNELNARLESNNLKLKKSVLYAPFDGQITFKSRSLGDNASAGKQIYHLSQNSNTQAIISIPSKNFNSFTINQEYPILVQGETIQAKLLGKTKPLDNQTQTHQLRFQFPISKIIKPNSVVTLKASEDIQIKGAWVPNKAMLDGIRGLWNLYVLTPEQSDSYKVNKRSIEVVYTNSSHSYVTGAINDGELFLISGTHKVTQNQRVKISEIKEVK